MNLKLQKILVFIPIINIAVAISWLICRLNSKKPFPQIIVFPVIAIGACLLGGIVRMIVDLAGASGMIYNIVTYATLYVQSIVGPFCMLVDEIRLK